MEINKKINFIKTISKDKEFWKIKLDEESHKEIQLTILRQVSKPGFLKRCNLVTTTMITWHLAEMLQFVDNKGNEEFFDLFCKFVENIEANYLHKMETNDISDQCIVMTIQSLQKLSSLAKRYRIEFSLSK